MAAQEAEAADNLLVKEVKFSDAERFVICSNLRAGRP
jgi:tRNA-binding EMAP/Myf-like protein